VNVPTRRSRADGERRIRESSGLVTADSQISNLSAKFGNFAAVPAAVVGPTTFATA